MAKKITDTGSLVTAINDVFVADRHMANTNFLHGDGLFPVKNDAGNLVASNGQVIPTDPPSMAVQVRELLGLANGYVIGDRRLLGSVVGTITVPAADSTNPRVDIVSVRPQALFNPEADAEEPVSGKGIVEILQGTPAATPEPPEVPDGSIELAQVTVRAGATSITSADLKDTRDWLLDIDQIGKDLPQKVAENTAAILQLQSDVASLRTEVNSRFETVESSIGALSTDVGELQTGLAQVQERVDGIDLALSGLSETVGGLVTSVGALSGTVANLGDSVADIVFQLGPTGNVGAAINQNAADIAHLRSDLEALAAASETTDTDLYNAIQSILTNDLPPLEAAIAQAQADIVENAQEIGAVYGELIQELSALDQRITLLEQGGGTIPQEVEHRLTSLEGGLADLHLVVTEPKIVGDTVDHSNDLIPDGEPTSFPGAPDADYDLDVENNIVLPIGGYAALISENWTYPDGTHPDPEVWNAYPYYCPDINVQNNELVLPENKGIGIAELDAQLPHFSTSVEFKISDIPSGTRHFYIMGYEQDTTEYVLVQVYRTSPGPSYLVHMHFQVVRILAGGIIVSTYLGQVQLPVTIKVSPDIVNQICKIDWSFAGESHFSIQNMPLVDVPISRIYWWGAMTLDDMRILSPTPSGYSADGYIETKHVEGLLKSVDPVRRALLLVQQENTPNTATVWQLSLDGGSNWADVSPGTVYDATGVPFNHAGSYPIIRGRLTSGESTESPKVKRIELITDKLVDADEFLENRGKINELIAAHNALNDDPALTAGPYTDVEDLSL